MDLLGFTLFDTPIGACAVVWTSDAEITGVLLPERSEDATRGRIARRFPAAAEAAPPQRVREALDAIAALLRGERADLQAIALDMSDVPEFDRRVYEVARTIAPGATLTYGEIAARLGAGGEAARDVGRALARNPFSIVVPCHRVVAAGGKTGGFTARGGVATKLQLLALERGHAGSALPLFERG
jgi:methylated-DNA-[protein]-cysteine S-methyltransferase